MLIILFPRLSKDKNSIGKEFKELEMQAAEHTQMVCHGIFQENNIGKR